MVGSMGERAFREGEQHVQRLRGQNKLGWFQEPKEEACGLSRLRGRGSRGLSTEIFHDFPRLWILSGGQGRALNNLSRAAKLSGVCGFLIKLFYFEMIIDSHAGVRNNTVRSLCITPGFLQW